MELLVDAIGGMPRLERLCMYGRVFEWMRDRDFMKHGLERVRHGAGHGDRCAHRDSASFRSVPTYGRFR